MSPNLLDIFILVVLGFSVVMFLTGNGDTLMRLFNGRQQSIVDDYKKDKMYRASLIFCAVLLANELCVLFLSPLFPVVSFITLGVSIAAFIAYVYYLKKYAKK